jgi:hypothetical protein
MVKNWVMTSIMKDEVFTTLMTVDSFKSQGVDDF